MMIWADVFETNLSGLRRYAAMAVGDTAAGDKIIEMALESLLTDEHPTEDIGPIGAYTIVDEILRSVSRKHGDGHGLTGRWKDLNRLERRLILLVEMEGLSLRDAALITGQPFQKVFAKFASARLKYADRFPARVCVVGADATTAAHLSQAVTRLGHTIVCTVRQSDSAECGFGNNPSVVLLAEPAGRSGRSLEHAERVRERFAGPVMIALQDTSPAPQEDEFPLIPWPERSAYSEFRRSFTQALLLAS